jgi:hypothetical protein
LPPVHKPTHVAAVCRVSTGFLSSCAQATSLCTWQMGGTSLVSCGRLIIFVRTLLRVQQYALIYAVPSPASGLRRYWRVPLFAGNVVLENTRERKFAKGMYCDIDVGLYILRGETMLLIAEFVSSRGLVTALLVLSCCIVCVVFRTRRKTRLRTPL